MELVQELFVTAVLAVLFSFLVAKLVSAAMVGGAAAEGETVGLDRGSAAEEAKFEGKLSVRGFECDSKVEELDLLENSVEKVHRIAAEPVRLHDVGVEGTTASEEIEVDCCRVQEKSLEAVERIEEPQKEVETLSLTLSEEIEVDRHRLADKSLEAVEQPLEEEKPAQCCAMEVKQEDDGSFEKNSSESAPDLACVSESEELKDLMRENEEVSKRDGDDEDDDWEGIERTELEKNFAVAAKYAGSGETNHCLESVGGDVKMQLFGLHKVATEGPCHEPQPMALKVSARSKWNAWQRLGNMSPDAAMEQYITLLSENVPGWKEEKCDDASKSDVGSPCDDSSKNCQTRLGDDRNAAVDTVHDVAESMDRNSENKAKD